MYEDFCIGMALKRILPCFQFDSEFTEIVDSAVENHTDSRIPRQHRLPSRLTQIKNRKAPVPEHGAIPNFQPFAIRAPSSQSGHHPTNALLRCIVIAEPCYTPNATHQTLTTIITRSL